MESIQTLLDQDSSVLFLAPTGWGKTTLLLELTKKSSKSIVYLSPLRALANEFYIRSLEYGLRSFAPKTKKELNQSMRAGIDFKLYILTAELLDDRAVETLLADKIIVFDEFHLFYYWGQTFRPKLLEIYDIVAMVGLPALLLTATASEEVRSFWEESARFQENRILMNLGNQKIKKEPKRFFFVLKKQWALSHLEVAPPGVKLVFCQYRKEAKQLAQQFRLKGYSTLSCVSGEVEQFQKELSDKERRVEKIDYIFCTSTLSHGVNLPEIACLYILYKVGNLDLWLQMAGRAGRRGEDFLLVSADRGNRTWKACLISLFGFVCHYVFGKICRAYHAIRRDYCP